MIRLATKYTLSQFKDALPQNYRQKSLEIYNITQKTHHNNKIWCFYLLPSTFFYSKQLEKLRKFGKIFRIVMNFFAVTMRDANHLILVFASNDEAATSLAGRCLSIVRQFQKPMRSLLRHLKQKPVSGKRHPASLHRKNS